MQPEQAIINHAANTAQQRKKKSHKYHFSQPDLAST